MLRYIVKRIVLMIPVLIVMTLIVFSIFYLRPRGSRIPHSGAKCYTRSIREYKAEIWIGPAVYCAVFEISQERC